MLHPIDAISGNFRDYLTCIFISLPEFFGTSRFSAGISQGLRPSTRRSPLQQEPRDSYQDSPAQRFGAKREE
jgi:hypothetical protein